MQICNGFLIPKQTKTRTFHSHKHFSMKDIKKKRNISYLYSSVDANTDANTKIDDNDDIQTIAPSLSELFPSLHKPLEKLGYVTLDDTSKIVFDTSEYGVPQTRKRVFVIGVKKKYSKLSI